MSQLGGDIKLEIDFVSLLSTAYEYNKYEKQVRHL